MLLLDLPDELAVEILAKLAIETDSRNRLSPLASGHRNIANFALTCHRAWTLSEPFLYSAVVLRRDRDLDLFRHLDNNDKRLTCLKDLALPPLDLHDTDSW